MLGPSHPRSYVPKFKLLLNSSYIYMAGEFAWICGLASEEKEEMHETLLFWLLIA